MFNIYTPFFFFFEARGKVLPFYLLLHIPPPKKIHLHISDWEARALWLKQEQTVAAVFSPSLSPSTLLSIRNLKKNFHTNVAFCFSPFLLCLVVCVCVRVFGSQAAPSLCGGSGFKDAAWQRGEEEDRDASRQKAAAPRDDSTFRVKAWRHSRMFTIIHVDHCFITCLSPPVCVLAKYLTNWILIKLAQSKPWIFI